MTKRGTINCAAHTQRAKGERGYQKNQRDGVLQYNRSQPRKRRLRVVGENMDVNSDVGDQASVVTRRISNVHKGNVVASEYHLQVRASILLSNVWYCVKAFVSAAEAFVV